MKVPAVFPKGKNEYEIRRAVFGVLFHRAQQDRRVEYEHLKRACGLRPNEIAWVPGNISEWTSENFGIFLTAFLVKKGSKYPGGGFFGLTNIPKPLSRTAAQFSAPLTKKDRAFVDECREKAHAWALRYELTMDLEQV